MARRTRSIAAYVPPGGRIGGARWGAMRQRSKRRRRPWGIIPLGNGSGKGPLYIPPGSAIMPPKPYMGSSSSSNRRMTMSVRPVGTGSSNSYYKYVRRPSRGSRIVKTQQAPLYSIYNSGTRLTSLQGEQAYANLQTFNASQLHQLYFETSANQDGRFWVDWARTRSVFQNQSEATTFLTIYEYTTRRDSLVGPTLAFQSGMASIQAGVGSTASDIGATPFMTPRFTSNFRILKKYNVELAQGRSHIHTSFYSLSRNYDDSVYQMDGGDSTVLAGWTRGIFYIAWGTPFNSLSNNTKVSTTPVAIDIVHNVTFATHSNLQNKSIFEIQTDFPTFSDGRILDIGSGEVEGVDAA